MIRFGNYSLPLTLMIYIGKQYFIGVIGVGVVLVAISGLFDMIELFRRASGKEGVTALLVVSMTVFKLPTLVQQLLPLIILFGGLLSFTKLAKARELVIARSVGISVWQILMSPFIISILIGITLLIAFNPISASLYEKFETMESKFIERKQTNIEISSTGLWLRDIMQDQLMVINAAGIKNGIDRNDQNHLLNVIVYKFDEKENFMYRLDAPEMILEEGKWRLPSVLYSAAGQAPSMKLDYTEPTMMLPNSIEKNFASSESLSFWELQDYIKRMKEAGFRTVSYQLQWYSLLASPFLLGAMSLIAAVFTLRSGRTQKLVWVLTGGLVAGFTLFLATHILNALGLSQSIPVAMAGWIPALVSLAFAISMLIHLEDG